MRYAFIDLDHTLYNGYMFFEWVTHLEGEDIFSLLDTAKMAQIAVLYELKILDYMKSAEEVAKEIAKMLEGKTWDEVVAASKNYTEKVEDNFYDYTNEVVSKIKEAGFKIVLVTNEPDFLAEIIKEKLGVDDAVGLEYPVKDGKFTGVLENDLYSRFGKANIVKDYCHKNGVELSDCISIGDSEGDIEMLKVAGKGMIINTSDEMKKTFENTHVITSERNKEEVLKNLFAIL